MARMPGAEWRPLPGTSTTPMAAYDVLCLHTMVGSLAGTDSYFRSTANGTNSHFGVGADGTIYQWVDTAYRSGASYNGNYHLISVETADSGAPFPAWTGSDVPAWTPQQIAALGRIAKWVHDTHGIPLTQIPDALPTRRGVGYHRLGVPGYMVAGAEQWSTKTGKVCPGDRRIAQVPQVIAAAAGGAPTSGGFLMALNDAQQAEIYNWVKQQGQIPIAVWNDQGAVGSKTARQVLGEIHTALYGGNTDGKNNFHWLAEQITAAVAGLARGIDPAEIEAAVTKALAENIVKVNVDVNSPAA